jgi:hypothetical protein
MEVIKALSTFVVSSFTVILLQSAGTAQSETGSYGLLWLKTDPAESEITLDGQFLDKSVWLLSLPPGYHTLRVRKDAHITYSSGFDIIGGQSLHLDILLKPLVESGNEDSLTGGTFHAP